MNIKNHSKSMQEENSLANYNETHSNFENSSVYLAVKCLNIDSTDCSFKSLKQNRIEAGLKKMRLYNLAIVKQALDIWVFYGKLLIYRFSVISAKIGIKVIKFMSQNILKNKQIGFNIWKSVNQLKNSRNENACRQLKTIIYRKAKAIMKRFSLDNRWKIWKLNSIGQCDEIRRLKVQLEETSVTANSYHKELIKMKEYNSFLWSKFKK
jgi:hypothetical protein